MLALPDGDSVLHYKGAAGRMPAALDAYGLRDMTKSVPGSLMIPLVSIIASPRSTSTKVSIACSLVSSWFRLPFNDGESNLRLNREDVNTHRVSGLEVLQDCKTDGNGDAGTCREDRGTCGCHLTSLKKVGSGQGCRPNTRLESGWH